MSSRTRVLYVGKTNDLLRRVFEHKSRVADGFTSRYHVTRLVHYEETGHLISAIERERQLKGWIRARKVALIEADNPTWSDLSDDWTA